MTPDTPAPPPLIADDPGLDFLNSVAAPWGQQIEWIGDGQGLLDWLEQAGLVPRQAALALLANCSPKSLDDIAAQAREIREWFRGFVKDRAGQTIDLTALADLDRLNGLIAHGASYRQIEPGTGKSGAARQDHEIHGSPLQWRQHRRWRTPEDLLVPIAEAIGDSICRANFARVKNCEGPKCTLWFHDTSKNHTRRWCMMSVCGNRAKAAAHRARNRSRRHIE